MDNPFWQINAGHVSMILSILLTHWNNRTAGSRRLKQLEQKVDAIAEATEELPCRTCTKCGELR